MINIDFRYLKTYFLDQSTQQIFESILKPEALPSTSAQCAVHMLPAKVSAKVQHNYQGDDTQCCFCFQKEIKYVLDTLIQKRFC